MDLYAWDGKSYSYNNQPYLQIEDEISTTATTTGMKRSSRKKCVYLKPEMKITKTKFLTFLFLNSWNCDTLKMSVCPSQRSLVRSFIRSFVCLSVCLGLFVDSARKAALLNTNHSIQFIHTRTQLTICRTDGLTHSLTHFDIFVSRHSYLDGYEPVLHIYSTCFSFIIMVAVVVCNYSYECLYNFIYNFFYFFILLTSIF